MSEVVEVKTSDFAVGGAPQVLATQGIGSCVAICLYDKVKKIGALAHIMLPKSGDKEVNPLRFVDTALPVVLEKLERRGAKRENLQAKIVGGAHMFRALGGENPKDLGTRNVEVAEEILKKEGIEIDSKDVGDNVGRSVAFFLDSGIVKVTTKM